MNKSDLLSKKKSWKDFSKADLSNLFDEWWEKGPIKKTKAVSISEEMKLAVEEEVIALVKAKGYKATSSCYGNIEHLLLTWPRDSGTPLIKLSHEDRLNDLLEGFEMEHDLLVSIITDLTENHRTINDWKNTNRFTKVSIQESILLESIAKSNSEIKDSFMAHVSSFSFLLPPDSFDIVTIEELCSYKLKSTLTTWIQDIFLSMNTADGKGKTILLEPDVEVLSDSRTGIDSIANEFATKINDTFLIYQNLGWKIEGGNLLIGDDFALIGADQIKDDFTTKKRVAALLGLSSAHKVYVIKSKPVSFGSNSILNIAKMFGKQQAFFHLDLFLTLAGKNSDGKERVVVGAPVALHEKDEALVKAAEHRLREVVAQLSFWGFEVIRNPMPFTNQLIEIPDTQGDFAQRDFFAFYNNCLVEIAQKNERISRKVWLPKYGSDQSKNELHYFDQENARIWRNLGFQTFLIGNYSAAAALLGGLHCSVKCIKRQPFYS